MLSDFRSLRLYTRFLLCAALLGAATLTRAADGAPDGSSTNQAGKFYTLLPEPRKAEITIAPASNEGELAIKTFTKPSDFKIDLFAAEPLLSNPVAFSIDNKGRFFVSETHRYRSSVLDIRYYMYMLEDDLASHTVDDREAMLKKYFGPQANDLTNETEVIRLVEDRTGSGKADHSSVYADKFNSMLDGIAAGVLARNDKVWFANIPNLWLLKGTDDKGQAKSREVLHRGFGVHFNFTGHDLHGLTMGPDGRIYFSVGDRGTHVQLRLNVLDYPDEGAVFRCNQDGTGLELFCKGLRNPQELAFDKYGNLFTGDNDADIGDHERWIYLMEGGDSGWRIGYQHHPRTNGGPWLSEKLWLPHFEGQAPYINPAIINIGDGPSGLAYYPGTGLPSLYNDRFFLSHFKGSPSTSGIQMYKMEPEGAGFKVVVNEPFIWNTQVTDIDFGPDGALYWSDWGQGWLKNEKGRIYKAYNPEALADPIVKETQKVLATDFTQKSTNELATLLGHPNMRVRQEAQFAIAARIMGGVPIFTNVLATSTNQLARIHAIWGISQITITNRFRGSLEDSFASLTTLKRYLDDPDPEIRCQVARAIGDNGSVGVPLDDSTAAAEKMMEDTNARVKFFGATFLGKLHRKSEIPQIFKFIAENADRDIYLRHAGFMALRGCFNHTLVAAQTTNSNRSIRLASLMALEFYFWDDVAKFLQDPDLEIATQAARAINDEPIPKSFPALASLITEKRAISGPQAEPIALRVVNANLILGDSSNATALAVLAANKDALPVARSESLVALGQWKLPFQRDRIVGTYRPLPGRSPEPAIQALTEQLDVILKADEEAIKLAAIEALVNLSVTNSAPKILALLQDRKQSTPVRVAALNALGAWHTSLAPAVDAAQADADDTLRSASIHWLPDVDASLAGKHVARLVKEGSVKEQQAAYAVLARIDSPAADQLLLTAVTDLSNGKLAGPLQLEVLESASVKKSPAIVAKLTEMKKSQSGKSRTETFTECLTGGDAAQGREIFFNKTEASCVRCHKIQKEGGDAGPNLSKVGTEKTREYILESIVDPNAKLAPGFETASITLKSGQSYAGTVKAENDQEITLATGEDGTMQLKKTDIANRSKGLSGMPDTFSTALSKKEIRNLVEFLSKQK